MERNSFLLYGANGYTGELIAQYAARNHLRPLLAGRNEEAVARLAGRLKLPYRIFGLNDQAALEAALREVSLVVHAAGPYDSTARTMVEACIRCGTHYIDLNGDHTVFEMIRSYDEQARKNGVMLLPGAGFDVVPTDCLALWLHHRLPGAQQLEIAFAIVNSRISRGTAITTLQQLGQPGAVRINGKLSPEPVGKRKLWVSFPGYSRSFLTRSIPWGDLSTAFYSTGIPNITTYTVLPKLDGPVLRAQFLFNWFLRLNLVRKVIGRIIHLLPSGPDERQRDKAVSLIQASARDASGTSLTVQLRCPEAYSLTAFAVLLISTKILQGFFQAGYQTPASVYGEDLIMEIPGVSRFPV